MSSTDMMSPASAAVLSSASSAALALARCSGEAFNSTCFLCHWAKAFFQSAHFSENHSEGCSVSQRVVFFFATIFSFKYSLAAFSPCQAKEISSKPSSFSGMENFGKLWVMTASVRSYWRRGLNHIFFSSSVNSAFGGSSSASTSIAFAPSPSSLLSSFTASPSSFASFFSAFSSASASSTSISCFESSALSPSRFTSSPSSFFTEPSADESPDVFVCEGAFGGGATTRACAADFFLASSTSFCLCSRIFLRALSCCRVWNSLSARNCLSFNSLSNCWSLNSWSGSPMTTQATFLKKLPLKRASVFFRSSSNKLFLTCMTT
mmetsp:Transcript_29626/g.85921  ORF Transcript_29626/g.85921 Transcript_29626/m.85921 type:complete len:321 (+) Transcript_29626:667-1629(+)